MTMVERVARALCWKNGMNPDLTLGGDGQNFLWHEYVSQARAAIDAMREPTPQVSAAVNSAITSGALSMEVLGVFVDAALSEEGE